MGNRIGVYLPSLLTEPWVVRQLTRVGKTQEICKPHNARFADEQEWSWVGICNLFFVVLSIRYISVVSNGGREAELEIING